MLKQYGCQLLRPKTATVEYPHQAIRDDPVTIPVVKIVSPPIEEPVPYSLECRLNAVCAEPSCAVSVLIDDASDLHFISSLLYDNGTAVPAITLVWVCPFCSTKNPIEEWVLAEAHLAGWPPPLTRVQADMSPSSELITRQARLDALVRYDAGAD